MAALNGHTNFYATPYGIISGCVSETGILEKTHPAAKGIGIVTGHKEMLADFMEKFNGISSIEKKEENLSQKKLLISVKFEKGLNFPKELQEMVLPANIFLGEFILNLHLEQYLHSEIKQDKEFLNKLTEDIETGKITVVQNGKSLKLEDKIMPGSEIVLKSSKI